MKSFIKNTNLIKSSWSKIVIFTFTSFLILHLINNSHITKACASVVFEQQKNSQQEQPVLESISPNKNNNKDISGDPKAISNGIENNDSSNTNFTSSSTSSNEAINVSTPKQESPSTHPKSDQLEINKTEPLGPKITKNDEQDEKFLSINDDPLSKFTTQHDTSSLPDLNLNIKVESPTQTPPPTSVPNLIENTTPPSISTTKETSDPLQIENVDNNVTLENIDERKPENSTLKNPILNNETVSIKNETLNSLSPSSSSPSESDNNTETQSKNIEKKQEILTNNSLENLTIDTIKTANNVIQNEESQVASKKETNEGTREETGRLEETENIKVFPESLDTSKIEILKGERETLKENEKTANNKNDSENVESQINREPIEKQLLASSNENNSSEKNDSLNDIKETLLGVEEKIDVDVSISNSLNNSSNNNAASNNIKVEEVQEAFEERTKLDEETSNHDTPTIIEKQEKDTEKLTTDLPHSNNNYEQPLIMSSSSEKSPNIENEINLDREIDSSTPSPPLPFTTTIHTPHFKLLQDNLSRMRTKNDDHDSLQKESTSSLQPEINSIKGDEEKAEEKLLSIQDKNEVAEENIPLSTTVVPITKDNNHYHEQATTIHEQIEDKSPFGNKEVDSITTESSNKPNQHTETLSNILRSATIHNHDQTSKETLPETVTSSSASLDESSKKNDEQLENETQINYLKKPPTFNRNSFPSKYCADIKPIRDLFNNHIEPIYHPIISMLPDEIQVMLLDETSFGGLSFASCLLITFILGCISIVWLTLIKKQQNLETNLNRNLNETILMLNNEIKVLGFEKQTFESEVNDLYAQVSAHESCLSEKDEKLNEALERLSQTKKTADSYLKELEKLRGSEAKCVRELNQFKLEFNDLNERFTQQNKENETQIAYLTQDYNEKLSGVMSELNARHVELSQSKQELEEKTSSLELYRENEIQLNNLIEQHEKKILILQNSLLRDKKRHSSSNNSLDLNTGGRDDEYVKINNDDLNSTNSAADLNSLMKNAELQMDIKNLEDKLNETVANYEAKVNECLSLMSQLEEKDKYCEQFKLRQEQLERNIKDSEIKIKVLNELREKDTKQHVKSLTELDVQLKKKTTDAEKVSHLLDQLRVKQERIHELESQFARIEKQSSQERQTFEKQAHENWLNAKRIDKELKETRNETNVLKEKLTELEAINKSLIERQNGLGPGIMPSNTRYYMLQQANLMTQQQQQQQQSNSNPSSNKLSNDSSPKIPAYDDPQSQQQHNQHHISSSNQSYQQNDGTNDSINGDVTTSSKQPDHPLEVDTNQQLLQQQRPPSTTSNLNYPQAAFPFNQMRVPFRYPFPPMIPPFMPQQQQQIQQQQQPLDQRNSTPSPSFSAFQSPHQQMLFRMQLQHQYTLQQQQQQMTRSGASSQQPSPGGNSLNYSQLHTSLPYSQSFVLNNSSLSNLNESSNSNLNSPIDGLAQNIKPKENANSALSVATVGQSREDEQNENVNSFNV